MAWRMNMVEVVIEHGLVESIWITEQGVSGS